MHSVCNIDLERREEILGEIRSYAARLRKKYDILQIYLYGSFASGEIHEGSDIDMIIVGDFKGRIFERIGEVLKHTNLPVEPLVYTPEQFARMQENNPFIKNVIAKAITL